MGLHYSDSSERARAQAAELSRQWKHHYLSAEHLFFACCSQDSQCRSWLSRRGMSLDDLQEEILKVVPEGDEVPGWEGLVESPRLRRILPRMAQEDAESKRAMRVEPAHIVTAILREGKGIPSRILYARGNHNLDACRQELMGGPAAQAVSQSSGGSGKEAAGEEKKKAGGKEKFLTKYARDLVELALAGKVDPVIGRNDEIRRVLQILTRKTKSNPVLIGEAGVGKTAVVFGLALRIAKNEVPDILRGRRVLDLNLSSMVAGAKHRGEFEERLEGVVQEAKEDPNIVLFIDEIHTLVGAGDSRGGMDASNILKPALARGDFPVLGATTTDEYRKYIEADPALERRFQPVMVNEPSEADAFEILKGLAPRYESHHGVKFTEAALLAAVKLSVRFLPDRNLPDKAIDLIDEAAAQIKTRSGVHDMASLKGGFEVTDDVVAEVVANWTGIPVSRMTQEESARLLDMEALLHQRVVGQSHAVEAVAKTIRVVRMGLVSPNRPSGVFLFLGPSGVGKTELAKALAEFLFGSEKDMVRLDMSEYHDKHSLARLIGSPPGYVGHDEEGQLTRAVRTKPYCVVLLDEVEKAHPEVFDIFLQVFDDGRLTDSKGRTVNFTNTIIVLTSNLGSRELIAQPDYENRGVAGQLEELPQLYQQALRGHFRPEFLGRIDEIVAFRSLEKSDLVGIVQIHLDKLIKTLRESKEVELIVEPSAIDFLLDHGYQSAYGARPLQRAIDTYIKRPLAEEMLRSKMGPGTRVHAYADGDKLGFSPNPGGGGRPVPAPSRAADPNRDFDPSGDTFGGEPSPDFGETFGASPLDRTVGVPPLPEPSGGGMERPLPAPSPLEIAPPLGAIEPPRPPRLLEKPPSSFLKPPSSPADALRNWQPPTNELPDAPTQPRPATPQPQAPPPRPTPPKPPEDDPWSSFRRPEDH